MSLIEQVARALYVSLGFEADDPWDQCVERRRNTGMTEPCLSNNQLQCMEAAKAAIAAMPQLEAMQAEIDRLRQIISDCATALDSGAMIRPDATLEFMGYLPDEIRLRVQKLKAASLDRQGK